MYMINSYDEYEKYISPLSPLGELRDGSMRCGSFVLVLHSVHENGCLRNYLCAVEGGKAKGSSAFSGNNKPKKIFRGSTMEQSREVRL